MGKIQKFFLLVAFINLLVSTTGYAEGLSRDSAKKLLAGYKSWIREEDDVSYTVYMSCPEFDLSDKEVLYYVADIIRLLKGRIGENACTVRISFPYSGSKYNNDFDVFCDQESGLQKRLNYAWPYWCGTDSLSLMRLGSGNGLSYNLYQVVVLRLNGAESSPAYLQKLMQIVSDGRATVGNAPEALAAYFSDWLRNNIEYDLSDFYPSSEGAVMHGKSVCVGYACAFYDLCAVAGIPALVPTNYKLDHAWNEIYINGQWYTLDMLNVVDSASGLGDLLFTDPDALSDDPQLMNEIKRQLISPAPFLLTKSVVNLNNKVTNIRNYICGLLSDASISCTSSDTAVIKTNVSGDIIPVNGGTATITAMVRQNGTEYTLRMNFKNPKPVPKKGEKLTGEKMDAVYVVTKAGSTVGYKAPKDKKAVVVVIPASVRIDGITYKVTSVSGNAFKGNKRLKSVTIGKNVEKIGASAFQNCISLRKITIPAKVSSIGKQAFYNCKNVTSIEIKSQKLTVKTVGNTAFAKAGSSNYGKLTVKVPKACLKSYKSLLKKKGLSTKSKIQ